MYCDLWWQYIKVRKLFKGGNYSREETIRRNTVFIIWIIATPIHDFIAGTLYIHNLYEVCTYLSKYILRLVCWYYHLKTFVKIENRCDHYSSPKSIQGRKLSIIKRFWPRKLFKGGNYSQKYGICKWVNWAIFFW